MHLNHSNIGLWPPQKPHLRHKVVSRPSHRHQPQFVQMILHFLASHGLCRRDSTGPILRYRLIVDIPIDSSHFFVDGLEKGLIDRAKANRMDQVWCHHHVL